MTTPDIEELTADDPQDILRWLTANSRWLTIASAIVVVGAAGYWIYGQSQRTKEVNASKALLLAQQSMNSGNPALAKSDLEKMTARYGGTAAGSEGAMLLAQLNFDQAKFQEGVAVLDRAAKSAPQPLEAEIRSLMGDGYMSMRNPVAAAKEYEHAADLTGHDMDRASQQARAARAYTVAGDSAKARQLWETLSQNTKNLSVAAEAKVRLGELNAKPATKG